MAHNGRQNASELLAAHLAAGRTIRDAAELSGLSERTAHRRMAEPEFRGLVSRLRGELVSQACGRLADCMTMAAETLQALLQAESETARLGAARSILEHAVKVREASELESRIQELERHHNERSVCDEFEKAS